ARGAGLRGRRVSDPRRMKIEPAASIEGAIAVPGVKGISQRAVLLGAIADGESRIEGFGRAADTETALSVVRQVGAEVDDDGSEMVRVRGAGLRGLHAPDEPLDFGNAGTGMRLPRRVLARPAGGGGGGGGAARAGAGRRSGSRSRCGRWVRGSRRPTATRRS